MAKLDVMDAFCERNGILKGWVAKGAGILWHNFLYAVKERGFTEDEQRGIELFLNERGHALEQFKWSNNQQRDINRLRTEFGIKTSFLAAQLNLTLGRFTGVCVRQSGFRPDELDILKQTIVETSKAMLAFRMPESLKKVA